MKKAKLLILAIFICIGVAGCASLQKAMSETTSEQQQQISNTVAPYIPQPYQIPASVLGGYLIAVAYNWFKDKTKPKA